VNDGELLGMSVEERVTVLEKELEKLLIQLYGEIPARGSLGTKRVSTVTNVRHEVKESSVDELREDLIVQETGQAMWQLSFYERLQGDTSFNHSVEISDITPIAQMYGKTVDDPDEATRKRVMHMDRVTDGNGIIGISDISSLAANYGSVIDGDEAGYNVYFRSGTHNGEYWSWGAWTVVMRLDTNDTYRDPQTDVERSLWHWDDITEQDLPEGFSPEPPNNKAQMLGVRALDSEGCGQDEPKPLSDYACFPTSDCPPIASLSVSTAFPYVGNSVVFDASKSKDLDGGSIVLYEWDFDGDGAYDDSGSSPEVTHAYGAVGTYKARVRVTDDEGDNDYTEVTINVREHILPPPNTPPIAELTADPTTAFPWDLIEFSAQGSYDPDGTIVKYEWDFDGDSIYELDTGTSDTASHAYEVPGNYVASVRVTDDGGKTDAAAVTITVEEFPGGNQPPVADLSADPTEGMSPLDVTLDASGSVDPDGIIMKYEWDWEGDSEYDEETGVDEDVLVHEYSEGTYIPSLKVTDNEGAVDIVALDDDIVVKGNPVIVSFTPEPSKVTAMEELVCFTSEAKDTDGSDDLYFYLDFNGDEVWEISYQGWHGIRDTGVPPYERVYWREDEWNFGQTDPFSHETEYYSKLKVQDNEGFTTYELQKPVVVVHAVPSNLDLWIDPFVGWVDDPDDTVLFTFDTDAWDSDGFIAKYEFDFGDGSPRETQEWSDIPFGEFEHLYGVGSREVTFWAYDDDYDWCDQPDAHRKQKEPAEVNVYGPPGSHSELIDNGENPFHDDGVWDFLGSPSIAVDVNPATGQPAVAYFAASSPSGQSPSAFFSQRDESGGWSLPSQVSYIGSEPWGANVGYQLDLMFDPVLFEEGSNENALPYVAATVFAYEFATGDLVNYGINVYFGFFDFTMLNWAWTAQEMVDDGSNSWLAPIRLVADCDPARPLGASLNQVVNYMHGSQYALMEAAFTGERWPEMAEVEYGQSLTGLSHDFKPYQGNNRTSGRGAVVYTQKVGNDYYLYYEVEEDTDYYWNGSKHLVATGVSSRTSRHVALDYFGDKVGIVWTTSDGNLYFVENVGEQWNPSAPVLIAANVGRYADFDYEDKIGVRTVAYETGDWPWSIYVKCQCDGYDWTDPILVDEQVPNVYDPSHLDMKIRDAYIYIAYSKNQDIYCHIMDFFHGNR